MPVPRGKCNPEPTCQLKQRYHVSSATLRRACKVHHNPAIQVEYSPFSLDIEGEQIGLLKTARELGAAMVAYSPLSRGLLTGRFRSWDDFDPSDSRRYLPRFSKDNFPSNIELVDHIHSIAKSKDCTPGQLTLAWLLAQGNDIFPIPGTTRIAGPEDNVGSLFVELSEEEDKKIRQLIESAEVLGQDIHLNSWLNCLSIPLSRKTTHDSILFCDIQLLIFHRYK